MGPEAQDCRFPGSSGPLAREPVLEGQSLGIIPPGADAEGIPHKVRLYSISSPRDGEKLSANNVAITVKRVPGGLCSNYFCDLERSAASVHPKVLRRHLHAAGLVTSAHMDMSNHNVLFEADAGLAVAPSLAEALWAAEAIEHLNAPRAQMGRSASSTASCSPGTAPRRPAGWTAT
jgi:hypothetical protein